MNLDIVIKKLEATENVSRNEIQAVAKQVIESNKVTFLNFCPNLGKSKTVLDTCTNGKVLMVHNQTVHITNFIQESKKFGINIENYTHIVWNSYHKQLDTNWDYIIIDECDIAMDAMFKFLEDDSVSYHKLILLTGTIKYDQLRILKSKLKPYIWKIDSNQAIFWGIFPASEIYIQRVYLSDTILFNTTKKVAVNEIKAYDWLNNEIDVVKEKIKVKDNLDWNILYINLLGGKRKKLLEQAKLRAFNELNYFERLKDKRTIFFMPLVEDCKKLGNSITFDSSKSNLKTIAKFNEGDINYLSSRKILDRAVSLNDIEWGVLCGYDFNPSSIKQKHNRISRGVAPKLVIFVTQGTKEETIIQQYLAGENVKYLN